MTDSRPKVMRDRERTFRLEAVVLRHSDWGEADRLIGLFSRESGKQRAIAKGARKVRSRKAGHLEPFTRVNLMLARGRDLAIITQAETVDAYQPLREDLLKTGYASYVVELLDRFTYEEGENRALFTLLADTLARIAYQDDPFVAVRYYEIRLLDLLGFRPDLQNCVRCGNEVLPEDQFFSPALGGVICPRCGVEHQEAHPVSMNALRFMRHYQRSPYEAVRKAVVPPGIRKEMEDLLQYYLSYLLERALNSPNFLLMVRQNGREKE